MALIQVKINGRVVFEKDAVELLKEFWDSFEELENIPPDTAAIDVVPD